MRSIRRGFALQSFDSFFRDDGNHDEGSHRVGPPYTEQCVEQQSGQQYRGQVRAKLCLFGVRMHSGTAQSTPHFSLGSREPRHDDQRDARQNNSGNAVLGSFLGPEIRRGFVSDVSSHGEKANTDNLERRASLVPLASAYVRINRHPPQQDSPRRNFDEAVDSKTYERNAACDCACDHSHQTFSTIPRDSEIFEPSSMTHDTWPFQDNALIHLHSLQRGLAQPPNITRHNSWRRFSKPPPTRAIFTDEISLPDADMLRINVCNTVACRRSSEQGSTQDQDLSDEPSRKIGVQLNQLGSSWGPTGFQNGPFLCRIQVV